MDCARKHGRYGHRDATMILVAYRHGLRASEVCDLQWPQIELSEGRLHVHRVKIPSAAGQSAPLDSIGSSSASGGPPRCHSRSTHTCFAMPAGSSWPMMVTTRGPCSTI